MTDKERYASIGTWIKVFQERGVSMHEQTLRKRLRKAGVVGETVRNQVGMVLREGFFAESDVRRVCCDLLKAPVGPDFQNAQSIKSDLLAFAAQLGEGKCPLDLTARNMGPLSIKWGDDREVRGFSYLGRAAVSFGFSKNIKEAGSKFCEALKVLLDTAGYEQLDKAYFRNPEYVKADLCAFAFQLGEDKTPLELSTCNMSTLTISCQNGQRMKGQTYIATTARVLGLDNTKKESNFRMSITLKHLLKTAGYEVLDENYFANPEFVKADLCSFAAQFADKSPLDLRARNMELSSIVCQNGQVRNGLAYLHTAAKALRLAKNHKDACKKRMLTLRTLKEIAGFLTPSDDQ